MSGISISTKLIATLIVIMGIGGAISSVLSIRSQTQLVLERDIADERQYTLDDAEDILYFVDQVSDDVLHLAGDLRIALSYGENNGLSEVFIDNIGELLKSKEYFAEMHYIANNSEDSLGVTSSDGAMHLLEPELMKEWHAFLYQDIFGSMNEGRVYVTVFNDPPQARQYYNAISRAEGPTILFVTPVFTAENQRSGSLVTIVNGQELLNVVRKAEQQGTADVFVLDSQGKIIAAPDRRVGNTMPLLIEGAMLAELYPEYAQGILTGSQSMYFIENSVINLAQIGINPGHSPETFTVMRVTPEETVFLPVNQLRSQLIISNIAQFGFVALALYILSRTFVRPLIRLTEASREIARGNFDQRVNVHSEDEIGQLGKSFNAMAERLSEFKSQLEARVQEKTGELAVKVEELEQSNRRLNEIKQAILNVMEDVDIARNNAEQEKARAEAYLDSIGEGVVAIDTAGKVMLFNRSAENIVGRQFTEVLHKHINEVVHIIGKDKKGNLMRMSQPPITAALQENKKITTEYYIEDGTRRIPVASTVTPIVLEGSIIGAVEVMRDVTIEKQIDMAKSEFVSMVSHQLRTPITTINWYIEMVSQNLQNEIPEEDREYLTEIRQASGRMLELINSLLDVSRIELGTLPVTPKPTDIVELSESVIKELQHEIDTKQLHFKAEYEEGLPQVNVDPKLMRMVFTNLLSNAVKYTDLDDSVTLRIRAEGDTQSLEGDLLIEVEDTGIGIPEDQQSRIFEKMFRADNVKDTDVNGTGLGLYIIRSMLERLGGKIWFESEAGRGSTFHVSLPLK